MITNNCQHIPVLLDEVLEYLNCAPNKNYIDGTLGLGGHAKKILEITSPHGRLIGIEQDEESLNVARERLSKFKNRITFIHNNFRNLKEISIKRNIKEIDGILFDLGISSALIDSGKRGFSFRFEAPLDMRMDQRTHLTAADLVNKLTLTELNNLIWKYGEERWAKKIAKSIVEFRSKKPIQTTKQLAEIIFFAIPVSYRSRKINPATKTFQALRIAVNDELKNLEVVIDDAIELLGKGSRICIISFHSLEDRIVKNAFKRLSKNCICPPRIPVCICDTTEKVKIITPKPVIPSPMEISNNPRARSAKLRVAEKL